MDKYKNIVEKALSIKVVNTDKIILEGVYSNTHQERMHPNIEKELMDRKHSLGVHPAMPDGADIPFENKIVGDRFDEIVKRYKRVFDVDSIDNRSVMTSMIPMVDEILVLEADHKKELIELAISMVREEYDMSEDVVEINAELIEQIPLDGTSKKVSEEDVNDIEWDSHDHISNINDAVYKRRMLNALIQGAAKKCNHMFHMVDSELADINPRLPNKYSKIMATADYMYYIIPKMENSVVAGIVDVEFPTRQNKKAVINVKAMIFPVLIHEIVKGVMELLSANGLPKDKKEADFVVGKADILGMENWDIRLGSALWGKFMDCLDVNDYNIKHHIYTELVKLPPKEFHAKMKEVLANTKLGKQIVKEISNEVKKDLQQDEFNDAVQLDDEDDTFDIEPFL